MTRRSFYFVPAPNHTAILCSFFDLDVAVAEHDVNCVGFGSEGWMWEARRSSQTSFKTLVFFEERTHMTYSPVLFE